MFRIIDSSHSERWFAGLLCFSALIAVIVLRWVQPLDNAWFPSCPLHSLGVFCPGCGTLRAIDSLLKGNMRQAVAYNALFIGFTPWFLIWGTNQAVCAMTGKRLAFTRQPPCLGWLVLGLVLVFFLLRNIPLDALIWLQPHEI